MIKKLLSAQIEIGIGSLPYYFLLGLAIILVVFTYPFAVVFCKAIEFVIETRILRLFNQHLDEIQQKKRQSKTDNELPLDKKGKRLL